MASRARHPFWKYAIQKLVETYQPGVQCSSGCVMNAAGPKFLDSAWNDFTTRASLEEGSYKVFDYVQWQENVAVHYWDGMWHCKGNAQSCSSDKENLATRLANGFLQIDTSRNCVQRRPKASAESRAGYA